MSGTTSPFCPPTCTTTTAACFARGLIIETSGADDEVVKVLAPLNIDDEIFARGLDLVEECVGEVMSKSAKTSMEVVK